MAELSEKAKERLHNQLIRLGDMMGDGLHLEPDGKWIGREYKQVARALGLLPKQKRPRNPERANKINEAMLKRVSDVSCPKCNNELKQTRKGSKRAACVNCGAKFQLLK